MGGSSLSNKETMEGVVKKALSQKVSCCCGALWFLHDFERCSGDPDDGTATWPSSCFRLIVFLFSPDRRTSVVHLSGSSSSGVSQKRVLALWFIPQRPRVVRDSRLVGSRRSGGAKLRSCLVWHEISGSFEKQSCRVGFGKPAVVHLRAWPVPASPFPAPTAHTARIESRTPFPRVCLSATRVITSSRVSS